MESVTIENFRDKLREATSSAEYTAILYAMDCLREKLYTQFVEFERLTGWKCGNCRTMYRREIIAKVGRECQNVKKDALLEHLRKASVHVDVEPIIKMLNETRAVYTHIESLEDIIAAMYAKCLLVDAEVSDVISKKK